MADTPWLTIIGLGEDGPNGLSAASHEALKNAEIVMGAARHLALVPGLNAKSIEWPVPYADGIAKLLALKGQNVVVLASGDPFWFGAGSVLTAHLAANEWRAFPGVSTFALAASRLGWALEKTTCLGLHARPFAHLRPHLSAGARALVLVRDGDAVSELARWLTDQGFGDSRLHVLEALGGPRERQRETVAMDMALTDIAHPVCVAIDMRGDGAVVPLASGRPNDLFANDGQITKRPVRALTLSALAPRRGEHLWDIGSGSGSIAIEWLMSHADMTATAIETDPPRAERITGNAAAFGVERLDVVTGNAPSALHGLPTPDAVFIGGGLSGEMLDHLWSVMSPGTRLVANAVTLESEALLGQWHQEHGGDLMRIELANATPLGSKRGWRSAYPIVQWSVTR
jgi:precorrin-6B C5,15-methyltransferase / cobalt-precorrin-6B C5,C15-methyltransferase